MKFKSVFYDSSINLKSISKKRIILAIILLMVSALVIYSFFYILREVFRVMSSGFDGFPNIISEENRNYYNLFFALLSVVFGNSIAFNYIFSRPQKITHRFNSKRKRLLNDNIFLSFNFSYWFAKVGLSFGVFAMCCMEFEVFPYFKEFSFLLILVLYLESIKSFSFFLNNKKRLKFIVLHVLLLSVISLGLSKINVVNYKGLDSVMLENNPIIDLPYSSFSSELKYSGNYNVSIKLKEDSLGILHFYSYKVKYILSDLPTFLNNERSYRREEVIPFLTIRIEANKNLNVYNLKRFEKMLLNSNQRLISYGVQTDEIVFPRYEHAEIRKRLNGNLLNINNAMNLMPASYFDYDLKDTTRTRLKDSVLISIGKTISWNNKIVKNDDLIDKFKRLQSKKTIFIYQIEGEASYQNYITVLSSHFDAIHQLRKLKQTIYNENIYLQSKEYKEEQNKLREEFPIIILEVLK